MIFCRTFKRFAGLMVQLLHKYHITAADSNVKLIKVITLDIFKSQSLHVLLSGD